MVRTSGEEATSPGNTVPAASHTGRGTAPSCSSGVGPDSHSCLSPCGRLPPRGCRVGQRDSPRHAVCGRRRSLTPDDAHCCFQQLTGARPQAVCASDVSLRHSAAFGFVGTSSLAVSPGARQRDRLTSDACWQARLGTGPGLGWHAGLAVAGAGAARAFRFRSLRALHLARPPAQTVHRSGRAFVHACVMHPPQGASSWGSEADPVCAPPEGPGTRLGHRHLATTFPGARARRKSLGWLVGVGAAMKNPPYTLTE